MKDSSLDSESIIQSVNTPFIVESIANSANGVYFLSGEKNLHLFSDGFPLVEVPFPVKSLISGWTRAFALDENKKILYMEGNSKLAVAVPTPLICEFISCHLPPSARLLEPRDLEEIIRSKTSQEIRL